MFLNDKQKEWLWEFWHGHERLFAEEARIILEVRGDPELKIFSDESIQILIRRKIRDMYKRRFPNARKVQIPPPKQCLHVAREQETSHAVYATKQEPDTIHLRPDFEGLMARALEEAYLSGTLSMAQGINRGKIPDYKNDAKAHAQKSITFLKGGAWPF